jgi:hypothetical protein
LNKYYNILDKYNHKINEKDLKNKNDINTSLNKIEKERTKTFSKTNAINSTNKYINKKSSLEKFINNKK